MKKHSRLKVALWERGLRQIEVALVLRDKFGFRIDDSRLAKMLNGWVPMPADVEQAIQSIVAEHN